jgi:hypothetical protein
MINWKPQIETEPIYISDILGAIGLGAVVLLVVFLPEIAEVMK